MRRTARARRKVFESFEARPRKSGWLLAPLLAGACTVYGNDLVDTTGGAGAAGAGGTSLSGGTGSDAGKGGTPETAGKGGDAPLGAGGADGGEPTGPDVGGTGGSQGGTAAGGSQSGGSSGGGVSGGNAGSGGGNAGSSGTGGIANNPGLIDGFEDGDKTLEEGGGFSGVWYPFDDATGGKEMFAISPLTDAPAELGSFALHVTASGFKDFGSGVGADFRAGKKPFDASAFVGVRLRAKIASGTISKHRLQLSDATTEEAGGKCKGTADATKCGAHFGATLTVTTTWATYEVLFSAMTQPTWGLQATAVDKAALYGLQITSKSDALNVDLWLDQIEFF